MKTWPNTTQIMRDALRHRQVGKVELYPWAETASVGKKMRVLCALIYAARHTRMPLKNTRSFPSDATFARIVEASALEQLRVILVRPGMFYMRRKLWGRR